MSIVVAMIPGEEGPLRNAAEPGHALRYVGLKADPALLAVAGDVDAGFALLLEHVGDALLDRFDNFALIDRPASLVLDPRRILNSPNSQNEPQLFRLRVSVRTLSAIRSKLPSRCLVNRFSPASPNLTLPPNPHSVRRTAGARPNAISCLGAFRTPAA